MKRLAGQAGRTIGYLLHHTGMVLITVFFVLAFALGMLAYRFSLGPIEIPWIASRLATAASGQGVEIKIGHAALAWGGYKSGGGTPLYLQLENIVATNEAGVELAAVPDAHLEFLPGALLGSSAPILVSSSDAIFAGSTVPVSMLAAIRLAHNFTLSRGDFSVTLGPGRIGAYGDALPVSGGKFGVHLTRTEISVYDGRLLLAPSAQSAPVITFIGAGTFDQMWHGELTITADALHADDLAAYWPPSFNSQAHDWVVANITKGAAQNAQFIFGLSAPRSLATLHLDSMTGLFTAENLSVGWLPGAAPITGVAGTLRFTDKDTIDIKASAGQLGGLALHDAEMQIFGIAHRDQTTTINIPIAGSVQDTIAVINAKPLFLLQGVIPALQSATGAMTGNVTASFPLKNDLQLGQVDLKIAANLQNATVPAPLPDFSFTRGSIALKATTQNLTANGSAQIAGEPAQIAGSVHIGATQSASFDMQTTAGNDLLKYFGLAAGPGDDDGISGTIPLNVHLNTDLKGNGAASLDADLTPASVAAPSFGWSKSTGEPGRVHIAASLREEQVTRLNDIEASAPGLQISGAANANMTALQFSQIRVGATQASGTITQPAKPNAPWQVDLAGGMLDITALLQPPPAAHQPPATRTPPASTSGPSGPLWVAKLNFKRFAMAAPNAPRLNNLVFAGSGQGSDIQTATASAADDAGHPLNLSISPTGPAIYPKTVHLGTSDAGLLLRAMGAFNNMQNGNLTLDATYTTPGTATGTIKIKNFRLLKAPAFAKILQEATIYGMPEANSGPGVEFSRLVAPFSISNQILSLNGARAFSASLGFTASGTIGLKDGNTNLDTTVIPAYAINSLPGRIPVIGRLFSAEKGGGLFAVRAKLTGPLNNLSVRVNPLSVVTPGLFRDIFGIGEGKP